MAIRGHQWSSEAIHQWPSEAISDTYQRQRHQCGGCCVVSRGTAASVAAASVKLTAAHRSQFRQRARHADGESTPGQEPWSEPSELQSPRAGPIRAQYPGTADDGAPHAGGGGGGGAPSRATSRTCLERYASPP